MTSPLVVDAADLAATAAAQLEKAIRAALAGGSCSVGLSGGSTPRPVYELLGRQALDWERIDFYYADERCVPPDDPESNHAMVSAALGAKARLHRMEAERKDREGAAADYAKLLPARLAVLVLGLGDDGHTCSLFPGFKALAEKKRRVAFVAGSPKPPPERLTITPPVIEAARSILMLASGKSKAKAVARALAAGADPNEVPASLAARDDALWLLDRDAASQLTWKGETHMATNENGAQFGMIGLAVMGQNLALNVEEHGFSTVVWNMETEWVDKFTRANPGKKFVGTKTFPEFVAALARPRRIMMMIKAGFPVDATIEKLAPLLAKDDILIDGGNSWFQDTQRREAALKKMGIRFMGMGVSGGEEARATGPRSCRAASAPRTIT